MGRAAPERKRRTALIAMRAITRFGARAARRPYRAWRGGSLDARRRGAKANRSKLRSMCCSGRPFVMPKRDMRWTRSQARLTAEKTSEMTDAAGFAQAF